MEKLKLKRKVLRSAISKLLTKIENETKEHDLSSDVYLLEEDLNLLTIKAEELRKSDLEIEELLDSKSFETEFETCQEYEEKINIWQFRAKRKIKEIKDRQHSVENESETVNSSTLENKQIVRLPKLIISKFNGDSLNWISFWNSFEVSIHNNTSLSKVEKFSYLKSYLCSSALSAIEGFSISEENYDSVVEILKNRFGRRDIIVHAHMNKLLNLTPVYKSDDTIKLRHLYDTLEIQVRSLKSLGVKPETYSSMLISVLARILPQDITLEFNRRNTDHSNEYNIEKLLEFIKTELECRERNAVFTLSKCRPLNVDRNQMSTPRNTTKSHSSTYGFLTAAKGDDSDSCLFCRMSHKSHLCTSGSALDRKELLRKKGLCFSCLGRQHINRNCLKRRACNYCGGQHNRVICFKAENRDKEEKVVPRPTKNKNESEEILEESQVLSTISNRKSQSVLLQTCCVNISNNTESICGRVVLDNGSMRSFIDKETAQKLKLQTIRKESLSVFTFGNKTPIKKSYDVVKVKLENRKMPDSNIEIEALVTEHISGSDIPPPNLKKEEVERYLKGFQLADFHDSKEKIVMLIGADYYYSVVLGNIKRLKKLLVATETIFGWCLMGRSNEFHDASLSLNLIVEENSISEQIQKFWDLESSGLINTKQESDPSESEVMKCFESDLKYENKRYTVKLPWKLDKNYLNDNKRISEERFRRLRKRFIRNPELFLKYEEVLKDYLNQDIIELVPDLEDKGHVTFYLPHREIMKPDRLTSKLRIVFDASSHDSDSFSLNDCLHPGPNLYPELFDILLRFRLHSVAFTTDIKQAFLQILIDEEDRDVTRFLFTENPFDESKPPQIYRFKRVLFGISSSPFLLAGTIKCHLKKYKEKFPDTVSFLNENVYVDDIIGSKPSAEQALCTTLNCIDIFKDASMHLHKWHTNSQPLKALWKNHNIIASENPETFDTENIPCKVLGIAWDNENDLLYFDTRELMSFVSKETNTKRFILQVLGRIFDPIGLLGPYTVRLKILMQKIWCSGTDWDEIISEDLILTWKNWSAEIPLLMKFSVPRHYLSEVPNNKGYSLELHLFSDSSMEAFGTVAYLRITTSEKDIRTVFVASKNRVAPLKSLTLPRLELMAALCSAKLSSSILKALKLKIPCVFWTDSIITYFWIRGSPEKFKPFVKNRVEEIRRLTSPSDWHHCPGIDNPADLVSRGTKVSKLINDPIWLFGPKWLSQPPELWPKPDNNKEVDLDKLEYNKKSKEIFQNECLVSKLENIIDICTYSNLEKLLRVTAWVKRFITNVKNSVRKRDPLTAVQDYVTKQKIIWKNIVERSPWWGGFYERLVKSVKECLHKILGKALLNFEEMTTVLTEVEAVLNLRPLSYVYGENDEPGPLTPMHFLNFGQNQPTYPVTFAQIIESGSDKSSLLKRRKYQMLLLKQLWTRWKKQYLLDLRTAHSVKNPTTHAEFKVGDVVLVEGNTKNKLLWKLGKIEKALPGRDNKVRCYELKTSGGLLRRTVQHLYPFEL